MDNTNNKQFLWNVKDFLGKKKTPNVQPQPSSLTKAISKVVNSPSNSIRPNIYEAKAGIVNSSRETKRSVSTVLNVLDQTMAKQKNSCKAYTNNLTANIFNLFKR